MSTTPEAFLCVHSRAFADKKWIAKDLIREWKREATAEPILYGAFTIDSFIRFIRSNGGKNLKLRLDRTTTIGGGGGTVYPLHRHIEAVLFAGGIRDTIDSFNPRLSQEDGRIFYRDDPRIRTILTSPAFSSGLTTRTKDEYSNFLAILLQEYTTGNEWVNNLKEWLSTTNDDIPGQVSVFLARCCQFSGITPASGWRVIVGVCHFLDIGLRQILAVLGSMPLRLFDVSCLVTKIIPSATPDAFQKWIKSREAFNQKPYVDGFLWDLWCFLTEKNVPMDMMHVSLWWSDINQYRTFKYGVRVDLCAAINEVLTAVGFKGPTIVASSMAILPPTHQGKKHVASRDWWYAGTTPPGMVTALTKYSLQGMRPWFDLIVTRYRIFGSSHTTADAIIRAILYTLRDIPDNCRSELCLTSATCAGITRETMILCLLASNARHLKKRNVVSRDPIFDVGKGLCRTTYNTIGYLSALVSKRDDTRFLLWDNPIMPCEIIFRSRDSKQACLSNPPHPGHDDESDDDNDPVNNLTMGFTEDRRDFFSPDEMDRLEKIPKDPRAALMFALLKHVALRNQAMRWIRVDDIWNCTNDTPRTVDGLMMGTTTEKGGKRRDFILTPFIRELTEYMHHYHWGRAYSKWLFIGKGRRPTTEGGIVRASSDNLDTYINHEKVLRIVQLWCKRAGIYGMQCHPHAFRKTKAIELHNAGLSDEKIMHFMHWDNLRMVTHYRTTTMEDQLQQLAKMDLPISSSSSGIHSSLDDTIMDDDDDADESAISTDIMMENLIKANLSVAISDMIELLSSDGLEVFQREVNVLMVNVYNSRMSDANKLEYETRNLKRKHKNIEIMQQLGESNESSRRKIN
jgi:integrase